MITMMSDANLEKAILRAIQSLFPELPGPEKISDRLAQRGIDVTADKLLALLKKLEKAKKIERGPNYFVRG